MLNQHSDIILFLRPGSMELRVCFNGCQTGGTWLNSRGYTQHICEGLTLALTLLPIQPNFTLL